MLLSTRVGAEVFVIEDGIAGALESESDISDTTKAVGLKPITLTFKLLAMVQTRFQNCLALVQRASASPLCHLLKESFTRLRTKPLKSLLQTFRTQFQTTTLSTSNLFQTSSVLILGQSKCCPILLFQKTGEEGKQKGKLLVKCM